MNLSFPPLIYRPSSTRSSASPRYDPGRARLPPQAREAEWNFRVSKGYVKDTFWDHLRFRLTHRD